MYVEEEIDKEINESEEEEQVTNLLNELDIY